MKNILNLKKINATYELSSDRSVLSILNLVELNFNEGQKSIAFGSTHYKNSQEKCIVLASDFFNKKFPNLKVLIVSFDCKNGIFEDFIKNASINSDSFYEFSKSLYFLEWENILSDREEPKNLVDGFDLVFWDLPDTKMIKDKHEALGASFEAMDSLYLISLKSNKFDDEGFKREIMKYYQDHGLDIRTILPWQFGARVRRPRSIFSQMIYRLFRR